MNRVELCEDRSLQDLPYKVELYRPGQILMSPTRHKHGNFPSAIACLFKKLLPHSLFENFRMESRFQAAAHENRLKAGLQTERVAAQALFQTDSQGFRIEE